MPTLRVDITAETVKTAAGLAARRADGVNVWADVRQHYLSIRQRGAAADWIVKTRGKMRTIGDVRERHQGFLSVRAARDQAASLYGQIAAGVDPNAGPSRSRGGWQWGDLDREYQAVIAAPRWINRRKKPPSKGTCDDARLAFAKPPLQALHGRRLTKLGCADFEEALRKIGSHRQREKCAAYVKAAFTWAAAKRASDSGLADAPPWWLKLSAGDPDPKQMQQIEARRALHLERKSELDVASIGTLLTRHEAYCAGRTAEDKISPGIRWGLWWVCLTANRRFSTVKLRRDDLLHQDGFAADGWGRAAWPADTMKAKVPFWLPLPPVVRDVAAGSIADYTQLVANEHGSWPSAWVFASTRRHGRDPKNDDVSVFPNSLNRHLLRMRKAKALDGLPYFSLHLARTVMANFLDSKVSPVASSLVLAHTLPTTAEEAAPTTREFYLTSQRMDLKSTAMRVWSEALIEAYLKAGGKMPRPSEGPRLSKLKSRANAVVAS